LPDPLRIPLAGWAHTRLAEVAQVTRSDKIAALKGATLLGERAALNGFMIPGRVSAGGGCRMFAALDGILALNLSRPDDRDLLPALVGSDGFDPADDKVVATQIASKPVETLIERGRMLGLALAGIDEVPASPASAITATGSQRARTGRPLVIDLSALWAGPLAAHLLSLSGAEVIKVESLGRPDSMREGDPALFALLNQGKANVALDLRDAEDRAALLTLIRRADVVIEAARPRALLQLGIDADGLVREVPGLVWVTITGHGAAGEAANWIGFGDDTAVAGGLSAALRYATGEIGFVGDAIGDPLTGIFAAETTAGALASGQGARHIVSMSGVVAEAIAGEDPAALHRDLAGWAAHEGQPFPAVSTRPSGPAAALGADNARLLT
jgi:hypothetical protein